jgi:hypothetical protein
MALVPQSLSFPAARRAACGLLLFALVPSGAPLPADVVHLKNGSRLEGDVMPGPRAGTLEVRTGEGAVIVVEETQIESVEKKPSAREDLERRLAAVPEGQLEPLVEILVWARDKRLLAGVRQAARKILEIDPNHELAREELGYVVFENRWVEKSELRKREGLIRHRGEWVTPSEKERRLRAERVAELEKDLEGVASDNAYVRDLSVRKVKAVLKDGDRALRDVAAKFLRHTHEEVRLLAVAVVARFPAAREELADGGEAAKRLARELHDLYLAEKATRVLSVARLALARFLPRESFRLGLETAVGAATAAARERGAEAVYYSLRKDFVPELCRSVVGPDGAPREEVRGVLRRVFQSLNADLGHDPERWLAFWRENESRFHDDG